MFEIFEQQWTLLIAATLVSFVMLMVRRIFPEKRHWWQLVLPLLFAVAAFGLDWFVRTDSEEINAVINAGVKAVEKEDCVSIETIISENYHDSYHNTKDKLMRRCRPRLSEPLVDKNYKTILAINISPSKTTATAIFTVRMIFDKQSYVYRSFKSQMLIKVEIKLQKEQDRWLINRVEVIEIDRHPVSWQDIR